MASFKEQIPGFVTGSDIEKAAAWCAHDTCYMILEKQGVNFSDPESSTTLHFLHIYKNCFVLALFHRPELEGLALEVLQQEFKYSWEGIWKEIKTELGLRRGCAQAMAEMKAKQATAVPQ